MRREAMKVLNITATRSPRVTQPSVESTAASAHVSWSSVRGERDAVTLRCSRDTSWIAEKEAEPLLMDTLERACKPLHDACRASGAADFVYTTEEPRRVLRLDDAAGNGPFLATQWRLAPFPLLPPVVPERPRLARCCWEVV